MVYLDSRTGRCRRARRPPAPGWLEVPGSGMLFRRPGRDGWKAAWGFGPDRLLWLARGWERVRFRPVAPVELTFRGPRSGLYIGLAPLAEKDRKGSRDERLMVVLPRELGLEAPAERPGAEAAYPLDALRQGLPPGTLVADLLAARILAAGLPLERAMWVLRGPPVSPADSSLLGRLRRLIELAERLSEDLVEAAEEWAKSHPPAAAPAPPRPPRAAGERSGRRQAGTGPVRRPQADRPGRRRERRPAQRRARPEP